MIENIFSDKPSILTALIFSSVYEVKRSRSSTFSIQRRWDLLLTADSLNVADMNTSLVSRQLSWYKLD